MNEKKAERFKDDQAYKADDFGTSKRQSTCHHLLSLSVPSFCQIRQIGLSIASSSSSSQLVEAAEMWSVDAPPGGPFYDY